MHNNFTPYPEVNDTLYALKLDTKSVLGEQCTGMYIHGSLALGDFNLESSDIDFLVTTKDELSEETVIALQNLHARIYAKDSKWVKKLEGSYIPQSVLQQQKPPVSPRLYINGGKCCMARYGSEWVLERYVLLKYGIVIEGPALQTLIPPIQSEDIKLATFTILTEWWLPLLNDVTRLENDEYQVYAVLTLCRILYTMKHEAVVSKPRAAAWVIREFDGHWRFLIEQALSWREDRSFNMLKESINFIRFTQEYIGHLLD